MQRGDIIQVKGQDYFEPVRHVSIVLHMANGQDLVYGIDEWPEISLEPEKDFEEIVKRAREMGLLNRNPNAIATSEINPEAVH